MWAAIRLMMFSAALVAAPTYNKPTLTTRVFPAVSLSGPMGCSTVLLTAEIKGPEDESWYCPKVEWELPDSTVAMEEQDCAPYELRYQCYPPLGPECGVRGWRRHPVTGEITEIVKECACTIYGYPHMWTRRVCAPSHPYGEHWSVWVRLSKSGKTLGREEIRFLVKG